jgi:hypothetical protein
MHSAIYATYTLEEMAAVICFGIFLNPPSIIAHCVNIYPYLQAFSTSQAGHTVGKISISVFNVTALRTLKESQSKFDNEIL